MAQFGVSDVNSSPAQISRQTRSTGTTPVRIATKTSVATAASSSTAVSPWAGVYVGTYDIITPGHYENYSAIQFTIDENGSLIDFFGSGGRGGFGRPESSGSVNAAGSFSMTHAFPSETGAWVGKFAGNSASGTFDGSGPSGAFQGKWRAWRSVCDIPPLSEESDRAVCDPVDAASGAFTTARTFLRVNCPAGLAFTIEYNSGLLNVGPLGIGWGHNYEIRVDEINSGQVLVFNWNQNRRNYFKKIGSSSSFACSDRSMRYDSLTKNANGSYTLLRQDKSRMEFNASGRLTSWVNRHGQAVNLSYNAAGDQVTTVTEAISGKSLSLSYDSSGRVSRVTDPLGRYVAFSYSSGDMMTAWGLANSANVGVAASAYTYDSEGRILTAKDGNGTVFVTNIYDSNGRVSKQDDALTDTPMTEFSYDEVSQPGKLVTNVKDRNGKTMTYVFDSKAQLLRFRDQSGADTIHSYDTNGNRLATTDARGNTTRYSYDANGNLLVVTDASGATTSMSYDASNNVLAITNAAGKQTTFTYDSRNNVSTIRNALNQTISSVYDANSLLTQRTSARGGVTVYGYTGGLLTSVRDPNNNTSTLAYDAAGRATSTTDTAGKTVAFTFDANDNVLTATNPLGQIASFTYDARRRKLTETDPLGNTTSYSYDGNGWMRTRKDALGNQLSYLYDGEGRMTSLIDARGGHSQMTYDPAGRLAAVTNQLGHTTTLQYDASGNLTGSTDARGNQASFSYDPRNLRTKSEDPHARINAWVFDNLRRASSSSNPLGEALQFVYDDLDRLVTVTDALSQVSSQAYDADGNVTSITNARNAATTFIHDLAGRLTSTTVPGSNPTALAYNNRNLVTTVTEPSGQQTSLSYDNAGRVTSTIDAVGAINYTYDATGRVLTIVQGAATISRVYDAVGRLIQFTDAAGNVLRYAYDASGNLTSLTYPDNKVVTYAYDAANRLIRVTDWASRVTTYSYDADGHLVSTTRPNGTVETRTWLPTGELESIKDVQGTTTISQFKFSYDLAGRIVDQSPFPAPATYLPESFTASYDAANRLTVLNGASTTFDADGNMTSGPRVTATGNATYVYDARNRLTSFDGVSYAYDAENRRVATTNTSGTTRYVINPNARLSQVLVRTAPDGTVTRAVYGLGLIYEESGSALRTYHYDFRGSAVAFTDTSGVVTGRVDYGPFCELAARTGDTATPFLANARFGVMTDSNGLYHMRARYYHPTIRRFINQDVLLGSITLGNSLNRFAYANGNPVSLIDPFGLSADSDDGSWWDSLGDALQTALDYNSAFYDWMAREGFNPMRTGMEWELGYNPFTGEQVSKARAGFNAFLDIGAPGLGKLLGWAFFGSSAGRVFWSGPGAKAVADGFATMNGGRILEHTLIGRPLNALTSKFPNAYPLLKPLWDNLSRSFARGAKGEVDVFLSSQGVRINSTWSRIEYNVLQSKGVTINYHSTP